MKDFILDLSVFAVVSCLPAGMQPFMLPCRGLVKKALGWLLESFGIWARAVRRDLES